jgi:two-component system sensor histidine kinase KdpD
MLQLPGISARATATGTACLLGVAGCTWVSFQLHQNLASAGFLYLVFVVLAAVYGGFWPATAVSVVSVACLDYYFNEPIFSFSVDRASNWVELAAFEFTALVVTRLSDRAQVRAREADIERRDTARLYETARRILLIDSYSETGDLIATLIRREFDLSGVFLFDAQPTAVYRSGESPRPDRDSFIGGLRNTYYADADTYSAEELTWFCALRLGMRPVGALALCGTSMSELNARALASLCAIALERARALDRLCHAEAAREAETLRTAVLDSLAHKFKTPLTVIRTAVAGVPAAGALSTLQTDLLSLIDQEARTLNDLAHRLVGGQELETREFQGQAEPLLLSHLVRTTIEELDRPDDRRRFRLGVPEHEPPVIADRELILTALAQLVDNALKYSVPDSGVDVVLVVNDAGVVLTVRSQGLVVAPGDRERIFDRFYRSDEARCAAPGTGLGLSIVRTIASDHQGHVWAEGEPGYGTRFSLALPLARKAAG